MKTEAKSWDPNSEEAWDTCEPSSVDECGGMIESQDCIVDENDQEEVDSGYDSTEGELKTVDELEYQVLEIVGDTYR